MAVDITSDTNGGVLKNILTEGQGPSPTAGDTVRVHYVGTLEDGTKFDSSRDRNELFEFKLGEGQVIKGWDVGVASMKKGEKCVLTCREDYAYGKTGSPPKIPGGATLNFEVELFDFYGEDISPEKDKGILKSCIYKPATYLTPNDDSVMIVDIKGSIKNSDNVFIEFSDKEIIHGEESEHNLPRGIEIALGKMKAEEHSVFDLAPAYGFGAEGNSDLGVPPNAFLQFDIHLKSFTKAKEIYEMDEPEKMSLAISKKEKASNFIKSGKYAMAEKLLSSVPKLLGESSFNDDSSVSSDEDDKKETKEKGDEVSQEEKKSLLKASRLNLALCYLKTKDYQKAVEECKKVLESDSQNEKAQYRLGEALLFEHEYAAAKEAYNQVLKISPENKSAIKRLSECDKKIVEEKRREKSLYKSMFTQFST